MALGYTPCQPRWGDEDRAFLGGDSDHARLPLLPAGPTKALGDRPALHAPSHPPLPTPRPTHASRRRAAFVGAGVGSPPHRGLVRGAALTAGLSRGLSVATRVRGPGGECAGAGGHRRALGLQKRERPRVLAPCDFLHCTRLACSGRAAPSGAFTSFPSEGRPLPSQDGLSPGRGRWGSPSSLETSERGPAAREGTGPRGRRGAGTRPHCPGARLGAGLSTSPAIAPLGPRGLAAVPQQTRANAPP